MIGMVKRKGTRKKSSMRKELLEVILPFVWILLIVVIGIVLFSARTIIINYAQSYMESESRKNQMEIQSWADKLLVEMNIIKGTMEEVNMLDGTINNYLESTLDYDESMSGGLYIGTTKGKLYSATDWEGKESYIVEDQAWYQDGLENEEFKYGKTYFDEKTQTWIVTASAWISLKNQTEGVMAADVSLDAISEVVNKITYMNDGTVFIIENHSGEMIAKQDTVESTFDSEKDQEILLQKINEKIKKEEAGRFDISVNNHIYYVCINAVENTSWTFVSCILEKNVLSQITILLYVSATIAILGALFIGILITKRINKIVKPMEELNEVITKITSGDFTPEIQVIGKNEIAKMAENMNLFIGKMRGVIHELKLDSRLLDSQANVNKSVSEELIDSASLQVHSMEQMNQTVQELSKSISNIAENTTSLANSVSEVDEQGKEANQKMIETVNESKAGREHMEKVNMVMKMIREKMETLEKTSYEVGGSTEEIQHMVDIINEIATQTNLLALNAAIEAARAGEAGRGFSIVADEIKRLAQNSQNSVKEIAERTERITRLVNNTVDQTKESVEIMKDSLGMIQNASERFDHIYISTNDINQLFTNMVKEMHVVDQVAVSVAAIIQEQSASAEEILTTSENLISHANEVVNNSNQVENGVSELHKVSTSLTKQIALFKVSS